MTHKKLLALIAGASLAIAGSGLAQTKAPAPAPAAKKAAKDAPAKGLPKVMTSVTQGTIKSISDAQLVIDHKTKAGSKDMTFVMNSSTEKQGDLKAGERVTVHYRKD